MCPKESFVLYFKSIGNFNVRPKLRTTIVGSHIKKNIIFYYPLITNNIIKIAFIECLLSSKIFIYSSSFIHIAIWCRDYYPYFSNEIWNTGSLSPPSKITDRAGINPLQFDPTVKVKVTRSCLTLCDPMDYTVHGILPAIILVWVAFPFFRGSSQPRDQTQVSHIAGGFFTSWTTREAQEYWSR